MKKTKRFFEELAKKAEQRRMAKYGAQGGLLANNYGLSDSTEKLGWTLLAILLVALAFVGIKAFFPDLITSIGDKLKEMLNTWSITTV